MLDRLSAKALIGGLVTRQVGQMQTVGLFNSQATMMDLYHSWLIQETQHIHENDTANFRKQQSKQRKVQAGLEAKNRAAMGAQEVLREEVEEKKRLKDQIKQK